MAFQTQKYIVESGVMSGVESEFRVLLFSLHRYFYNIVIFIISLYFAVVLLMMKPHFENTSDIINPFLPTVAFSQPSSEICCPGD